MEEVTEQPIRGSFTSLVAEASTISLSDKSQGLSTPEEASSLPGMPSPSQTVNPSLYKRLDETKKEIRLLFLQPATSSWSVQCTLDTFSLASHPFAQRFEALSYEWGAVPKSSYHAGRNLIYISTPTMDTGHRHTVSVRPNLLLALQNIRSTTEVRVLWIDAICVNQDDVNERNHQVGLMRMIYSTAKRVRVWLGPEDKEKPHPFDLLYRITHTLGDNYVRAINREDDQTTTYILDLEDIEKPETSQAPQDTLRRQRLTSKPKENNIFNLWGIWKRAPDSLREPETEIVDPWEQGRVESIHEYDHEIGHMLASRFRGSEQVNNSDEWIGLQALLRRSYWTRIWIVQEFVLARELILHCGDQSISWNEFSTSLEQIRTLKINKYSDVLEYLLETATNNVDSVNESVGAKIVSMRDRAVTGRKHRLLELFESTKNSKCCDRRDRVFALLGLASDVHEDSIVVDYTRSAIAIQADVMNFFRHQPQSQGRTHDLTYISSLLISMLHEY